VIINDRPWSRGWSNRTAYVHPYAVQRYEPARREERHELHERTTREREAARVGRERVQEHRGEEHRR
jgi:hypothetical protein